MTTPPPAPSPASRATPAPAPPSAAQPAAPPSAARHQRLLTAGAATLLLVGLGLAVTRPAWLTEPLQGLVEAGGLAAPLVFVALCVLSVPLHLTPVVVVLSPLLFPLPEAAALSFVGSMIGCVLTAAVLARTGASTARRDGTAWPAWLTRLTSRVGRRPLVIGLVVRLMLNTGLAVEAFFVLTGYTRRQYLLVTTIGVALWIAQALLGVTALYALNQVSPLLALLGFLVPLLSVGVVVYLRRRRRTAA